MEQVQIPWISTKDGLPEKPGKSSYEHVACLVITQYGLITIFSWNCEENYWDDEDEDDYKCDAFYVEYYIPLSQLKTPE
jgi:hypothetical protein